MNTAEFLLRKHFPTGQSQEKRLLLSLGDEEIAYGIYPEIERSEPGKDFVNVIPDVVENGCLAGICPSSCLHLSMQELLTRLRHEQWLCIPRSLFRRRD